jgi:hypothetical protein
VRSQVEGDTVDPGWEEHPGGRTDLQLAVEFGDAIRTTGIKLREFLPSDCLWVPEHWGN